MANMTISVNDNTKREFTKFKAPIRAERDDIAELESDIEISRREFAEGKGIPNDVVFDEIHKKLLDMKAGREAV